jgi:hypothetical protein
VFDLYDQVSYGESGSQLIIGHAASGKSTLVAVALAEIFSSPKDDDASDVDFDDEDSPFSLVTLFCSTLDDDLSALRSITRQLRLENVVGDKVCFSPLFSVIIYHKLKTLSM